MPEHYTKNTLECTAWCKKCDRMTQHRVDGGRRGPCIDPQHPVAGAKQDEARRRRQEKESAKGPRLFPR